MCTQLDLFTRLHGDALSTKHKTLLMVDIVLYIGMNESVVGIFVYAVDMYSAKCESSYVALLGIVNISTAWSVELY